MTKCELLEIKALAVDVMLNAIDCKDFEQFNHGLRLWQDITRQIKERS